MKDCLNKTNRKRLKEYSVSTSIEHKQQQQEQKRKRKEIQY